MQWYRGYLLRLDAFMVIIASQKNENKKNIGLWTGSDAFF